MKVRTLQSLSTPRGEIPAGEIISIPYHLAERLKGKVEALADTSSFSGAVEIVTPEGDCLWVVTEPAAVKLVPEGTIYFTGDEVTQLQKVGKEAVRAALMVKRQFHGAVLEEVQA